MGSLFQVKELWSCRLSDTEINPFTFVVDRFDNDDETQWIAVGSLDGTFRVLQPTVNDDSAIIYEQKFDEPILQIMCGNFGVITSDVSERLLAILFPHRLLLARFERQGEEVKLSRMEESREGGEPEEVAVSIYKLNTHFSLSLSSSSYNMTAGQFGNSNHDLVCVQSLDGRLTLLDNTKVLLAGSIPADQFLIPGCLAYCSEGDQLITNNSSLFLMSYSFPTLVHAFESNANHFSVSSLKPTWAFNVGEDVVDLTVCKKSDTQRTIVVLCSYSLYCFTALGVCCASRRLDVEAISLTSYRVPSLNLDHYLVGTCTGLINVYSGAEVLWGAHIPNGGAAVALQVGSFNHVDGMIAALYGSQHVAVGYLGTDPSESPMQITESRVHQYTEMLTELSTLNVTIKDIDANPERSSNKTSGAVLDTGAAVSSVEEYVVIEVTLSDVISDSTSNSVDATVSVSLSAAAPVDFVSSVTIMLTAVEPICCNPSIFTSCADVVKGEPVLIRSRIQIDENAGNLIPSSLTVKALVNCLAEDKKLFTSADFRVPLSLVAEPVAPVKSMSFSIQLNTEKTLPPSLTDLFSDLVQFGKVASNVLCIRYWNGAKAMILVSKNAARFKIQATNFESMWILLSELMNRVTAHYAKRGEGEVEFQMPDDLPLKDYLGIAKIYDSVLQELLAAEKRLDESAHFFRVVQKRLLSRFREKNPSSTESIEILFQESCFMIQHATDGVAAGKARMKQACAMLNAASLGLREVLLLKYPGFSKAEKALYDSFQCPISDDSEGTRWTEVVYYLTHKLDEGPPDDTASTQRPPSVVCPAYTLERFVERILWLDTHFNARETS